jgi:hypothetical protein
MDGGPLLKWIVAALFCLPFGFLAQHALRYATFRRAGARLNARLVALLRSAGIKEEVLSKLANQVLQSAAAPSKVRPLLQSAGLAVEQRSEVMKLIEGEAGPLLRRPLEALQSGRFSNSRFASTYTRSLILSLFVLLWFFIVPVPGLFVFAAREYRISVELSTILTGLSIGITFALISYWIGLLIQRFELSGLAGSGLAEEIQMCYRQFQERLRARTQLSDHETSSLYALFTDAQTYLDQHSFEYVRRCVEAIKHKLAHLA